MCYHYRTAYYTASIVSREDHMKHYGVSIRRLVSVLTGFILLSLLLLCPVSAERTTWDCPNCGRKGNTDNFCGSCAQPKPKDVKAGDLVDLGHYEQDNNPDNGREAIEWIVLDVDKKNQKALLLSRYGLRNRPYHNTETEVTWKNCTLRKWLNDKFLNSVFTAKEQAAILTTKVDNGPSQGYSEWNTKDGENTEDKIFLLSCAEANRYLGVTYDSYTNIGSRAAPTEYAIAQGAWKNDNAETDEGKAAGWWWLRSPGPSQSHAAIVLSEGALIFSYVNWDGYVVRPALWIDLETWSF